MFIRDREKKENFEAKIKSPLLVKDLPKITSNKSHKILPILKKSITAQTIPKTAKHYEPINKANRRNSNANDMSKIETESNFNGFNITASTMNHNFLKEEFIKDLAFNLRQLALANVNENLTASAIEKISNKNTKIIDLVSPKSHKLTEYDLLKLEKKFKNIEMLPSGFSLSNLPPIDKKKNETVYIEPYTLKLLTEFNNNLEQYNIQKKVEGYKNAEEFLVKVGNKIREDEIRLGRLLEKPELKEFAENRSGFKAKSLVQPKYFTHFAIARKIDEYELMSGEMKLVKRRNLAVTRALQDLVDRWCAGAKKT